MIALGSLDRAWSQRMAKLAITNVGTILCGDHGPPRIEAPIT
jgi:hypothetical protein